MVSLEENCRLWRLQIFEFELRFHRDSPAETTEIEGEEVAVDILLVVLLLKDLREDALAIVCIMRIEGIMVKVSQVKCLCRYCC